jgi:hypothetical protein
MSTMGRLQNWACKLIPKVLEQRWKAKKSEDHDKRGGCWLAVSAGATPFSLLKETFFITIIISVQL